MPTDLKSFSARQLAKVEIVVPIT